MANYEMDFSTPSSISADKVTFNPSGTDLQSTDVEGAIKEVKYDTLFHVGDRIYLVKDKRVDNCLTMLFGRTSSRMPRIYLPLNKPLDASITGATLHGLSRFTTVSPEGYYAYTMVDTDPWTVTISSYNLLLACQREITPMSGYTYAFPNNGLFFTSVYGADQQASDYRDVYIEFT